MRAWFHATTLAVLIPFAAVPACNCGDDLIRIPAPGSITGQVCDPGAHKAIPGADVYVVTTEGGTRRIDTTTDGSGNFTLNDVPPGTYTVFVERGAFHTEVDNVTVAERKGATLAAATCIAPTATVNLTVVTGHDTVQDVLTRIGYSTFTIIDSHDRDHTSSTPNWFVDTFKDLATVQKNDIIFINCGAHEWVLTQGDPAEIQAALANFRAYVEGGGAVYLSDWAYNLLEAAYPDAVDWLGNDAVYASAEHANKQTFTGNIVDAQLAQFFGRNTADLSFELAHVAIASSLGAGSTALITADLTAVKPTGNQAQAHHTTPTPTPLDLSNVPVVFQFVPPNALPNTHGRVIYTSAHNGASNTADTDQLLRAIIFSL